MPIMREPYTVAPFLQSTLHVIISGAVCGVLNIPLHSFLICINLPQYHVERPH